MNNRTEYRLIGRGLGGWHASGVSHGNKVSSSGGSLLPESWWAGGMTTGYLQQAAEGCLVYDASTADEVAFVSVVLKGPMCDPTLKPFEVDCFSDKDRAAAEAMMPGLGGGYKALAMLAQSQTYGGLDCVGVGIYEGLLRKVPGMKIGHVKQGAIEWDETTGTQRQTTV
jgi:hypothetical protein